MTFGKEKEKEIFSALANRSTYKVGLDFGLDKVYKDSRSVRNAVTSIYNKVKNHPEEYGLSTDTLDIVAKGMEERRLASHPANHVTMAEKQDDSKDIKELVIGVRDKMWTLIDKKLDRVMGSRKKVDEISFTQLQVLAGIAFDKSQILKGEATENIAVMAKIDQNMTADEALKAALSAREMNVEKNMS